MIILKINVLKLFFILVSIQINHLNIFMLSFDSAHICEVFLFTFIRTMKRNRELYTSTCINFVCLSFLQFNNII